MVDNDVDTRDKKLSTFADVIQHRQWTESDISVFTYHIC